VSLIKAAIEAEEIPRNFTVVYGVSNNTFRVHDWKNSLGWTLQNNAEERIQKEKSL
jgi:hypothetical protein